jgi:hypothetical protein
MEGSMSQRRKIKRSEIHRMAWEQPLSKLAPELGLSDVGLRKLCVRYNIPLPPQGHWAKAPERRSPHRTPLSQPQNDRELEFLIPPQATPQGQSELEEKFGAHIAAEALPENRITVVDHPETPHPMTKAASKCLERARPDQFGAISCAIPAAFRVRVPRESVGRALRIIDALAKAFDARGLTIERGGEKSSAAVRVAGQALRLSLEETSSRQVHRATEAEKAEARRRGHSSAPLYDFRPSGVMTLKIDNIWQAGVQSSWRDTPARRLEARLNEAVAGLYRAAHAIEVGERKQAERQRRVDAENARRAALRAERDNEAKFFNELEVNAAAWQRAQTLRAFIAAVEAKARGGGGDLSEEKTAWLSRARRLADRVDPLVPNPSSPLDFADRDLRPLYGWEMPD